LESVCRSYGFYERSCPLIYTLEGNLIGDGAQFVEHVRDRYNKVLSMTKENQKRRTHENITMINEQMRKKKEGATLEEKIFKHLETIKKKNAIQLVNDAFYAEEKQGGNIFFVRRTNLQRDGGRTHDVVDEIEIELKRQREEEEKERTRDMKFSEFKSQFIDHIEGRATNERKLVGDSEEEEPRELTSGKQSKSKKTDANASKSDLHTQQEEENLNNASQPSLKSEVKSS